jgi:hypothetical protein
MKARYPQAPSAGGRAPTVPISLPGRAWGPSLRLQVDGSRVSDTDDAPPASGAGRLLATIQTSFARPSERP